MSETSGKGYKRSVKVKKNEGIPRQAEMAL